MKVTASTAAALMLFASAAVAEPLPEARASPTWWNTRRPPPPVSVTTCPQFANDPYARYAIHWGLYALTLRAQDYQWTGLSKDSSQELLTYFIEAGGKALNPRNRSNVVDDIEFIRKAKRLDAIGARECFPDAVRVLDILDDTFRTVQNEKAVDAARLTEREEAAARPAWQDTQFRKERMEEEDRRVIEATEEAARKVKELAELEELQERANQEKLKAQAEAAHQAGLAENRLRRAYANYLVIQICNEVRQGYAAAYINDDELERARIAEKAIEEQLITEDPSIASNDVFRAADQLARTRLSEVPPSFESQISVCRAAFNDLIAATPVRPYETRTPD